jgi:hypothetical protein
MCELSADLESPSVVSERCEGACSATKLYEKTSSLDFLDAFCVAEKVKEIDGAFVAECTR